MDARILAGLKKILVRKERLELSRVAPLEPKSSASANSATFAQKTIKIQDSIIFCALLGFPRKYFSAKENPIKITQNQIQSPIKALRKNGNAVK